MTVNQSYAGMTYEEVVEQYSNLVTGICVMRCGNIEDAKDCYQTVFLKLLLTEGDMETEEHLRSWLIKVAVTTSLDYVKQYWHKNIVLYGNDRETMNMIDTLTFSEEKISSIEDEAMEQDSLVMQNILALPVKYRQVIYLYYVEEYDTQKIGDLLGIRVGTIKSQLARGRKLLKNFIL